jgi:hypothetical protein
MIFVTLVKNKSCSELNSLSIYEIENWKIRKKISMVPLTQKNVFYGHRNFEKVNMRFDAEFYVEFEFAIISLAFYTSGFENWEKPHFQP